MVQPAQGPRFPRISPHLFRLWTRTWGSPRQRAGSSRSPPRVGHSSIDPWMTLRRRRPRCAAGFAGRNPARSCRTPSPGWRRIGGGPPPAPAPAPPGRFATPVRAGRRSFRGSPRRPAPSLPPRSRRRWSIRRGARSQVALIFRLQEVGQLLVERSPPPAGSSGRRSWCGSRAASMLGRGGLVLLHPKGGRYNPRSGAASGRRGAGGTCVVARPRRSPSASSASSAPGGDQASARAGRSGRPGSSARSIFQEHLDWPNRRRRCR